MISATTNTDILRPSAPPDPSLKGRLTQWGMAHMDDLFRVIRTVWPIPAFGSFAMVTRYTDVQEVMSLSEVFINPYIRKFSSVAA